MFLYPGVPATGLGWLIKALLLGTFAVYLWIILQELQVNMIAAAQAVQVDDPLNADDDLEESEIIIREKPPAVEQTKSDYTAEFSRETSPVISGNLEATEAYHDFQELLLRIIAKTYVSHVAVVYIADPSANNLVLQDSYPGAGVPLSKNVSYDEGLLGRVITEKQPILWTEDKGDQDGITYYSNLEKPIRSFLGVPIRFQRRVIGVLAIDNTVKESYSNEDQKLLEIYAELLSSTIPQFDRIDKLQDERIFYQRLCDVNSKLTTTYNKEEFFNQIIEISQNIFKYDRISIVLLQEQNSRQAEVAKQDSKEPGTNAGYRFELKDSHLSKAIDTGKPMLCKKIDNDKSASAMLPELLGPGDVVQSLLIVPIRNHKESYGAIILESAIPGAFSDSDLEILEMIGSVFGAGLNRFYLYRYMKNIASKDGLTGIYNYRTFHERLEEEIQRSARYQNHFALCIMDLDNFKRVNDTHGHLYGDYMLKTVANIIKGSIRSVDLVARYGGEEFAVILVNASAGNALNTANRIKKSINDYTFEKDNITEHITISIGIAEYPTHAADTEDLLENADMAMYQVKKVGGNSVKSYKDTREIEGV